MGKEDAVEVLINATALMQRTQEIAALITNDYQGKELLLVGVLRGAIMFMTDLARAIKLPVMLDFIAVSSYGHTTKSSGIVRMLKDLEENVAGKHLLLVEDIVDTGLTLRYLIENLQARQPASLKVCTLLNKPSRRKVEVQLDYVGFTVPDQFIVGYGLDYAQKYRNLPFIGVLPEKKAKNAAPSSV